MAHPLTILSEQDWRDLLYDDSPALLKCCESIEEVRAAIKEIKDFGLDWSAAFNFLAAFDNAAAMHDLTYSPILMELYTMCDLVVKAW